MATNLKELQDSYDELNEAVQEALAVLADDRYKLSGKVAKIAELLEPFEDEDEE